MIYRMNREITASESREYRCQTNTLFFELVLSEFYRRANSDDENGISKELTKVHYDLQKSNWT